MKRIDKGQYGYLKYCQKKNLILCGLCSAAVVILISIGQFLYHTNMNLLIVPAILCVLPAANFLVSYLAVSMFSTAPREQYDTLKAYEDAQMLLSDLVLVDEKGRRHGVDFAVVYKGGIVGYQSSKKDTRDLVEVTVNSTLKRRSLPMRMKVFRDWNAFLNRINELELPANEEEKKRIIQGMEAVIASAL